MAHKFLVKKINGRLVNGKWDKHIDAKIEKSKIKGQNKKIVKFKGLK
jgi:hypothetical protein